MHIKITAVLVILAASLRGGVATPDPDPQRQLRVPRIYNALITTNEKLQPSRAYPHAVPVLQPLAPGFAPPLAVDLPPPTPIGDQPAAKAPQTPGKMTEERMQYPLTFYPRQFGYYPQPLYPYQYPSPYPYYPGAFPYNAVPAAPYPTPTALPPQNIASGRQDQERNEEVEDDYDEASTSSSEESEGQ